MKNVADYCDNEQSHFTVANLNNQSSVAIFQTVRPFFLPVSDTFFEQKRSNGPNGLLYFVAALARNVKIVMNQKNVSSECLFYLT